MQKMRRLVYAAITVLAGTSLALLPSSAFAADVDGSSYRYCANAYGFYDYTRDGSAAGYPKYDTSGVVAVRLNTTCGWIDGGVLQYTGYEYRAGVWRQIPWQEPWSNGFGDYSVKFNDVRDIRLRVCNIQVVDAADKISGCGVVS
ncbi:hypothetical protein GCM10011579_034190 [Streptomyces albiflavescens]|uniref:Secreted protein n=1 Tax=Streptomyces albiflavescens TaxID=1623582 RepID=A0A917Y3Z0_9ACTN|nr:hypothetical protein [Streptomyces albiflavescens]GGN64609.1 hypothetical protein GCM10011579_034190 [Streptomyces albiflavescens]